MNKKGLGMGPAIVVSVILLILFLVGTNLLLDYGKTNVVKVAKADTTNLEAGEVLFNLLNLKSNNFNLADLIVLGNYDKVEILLRNNLPKEITWTFKAYDSDFKNIIQSKPLYALDNIARGGESVETTQQIKNYFGGDLIVHLEITK